MAFKAAGNKGLGIETPHDAMHASGRKLGFEKSGFELIVWQFMLVSDVIYSGDLSI